MEPARRAAPPPSLLLLQLLLLLLLLQRLLYSLLLRFSSSTDVRFSSEIFVLVVLITAERRVMSRSLPFLLWQFRSSACSFVFAVFSATRDGRGVKRVERERELCAKETAVKISCFG